MVLYNITFSLDPVIADEWLDWMRTNHIPAMMATGCFAESRISRVHGEEEGGVTYAVMYLAPSEEKLNEYYQHFAQALNHKHAERFHGRFANFGTTLSVIEEFK